MTWVVGMPGFVSGAVAIADVRITVSDRRGGLRLIDGVQKLHYVGDYMALGFAGSVELGLALVGDLRSYIARRVPPDHAAWPCRMTQGWSRRVRWLWESHVPRQLKSHGLQLMVLGAHPREENPFPATHVLILESPTFELQPVPWLTARSIGSGGNVDEYRQEVESLGSSGSLAELAVFQTSAFAAIGGPALPIVVALTDAIGRRSEDTVSEHLHYCVVTVGEVKIGTNDVEGLSPGAPSRTMPSSVATTMAEYRSLAARHGFAAALAKA